MMTTANGTEPRMIAQEEVAAQPPALDEMLYLTGRPSLRRFVGFVQGNAAEAHDKGALVDEWHAAREVVRKIKKEEPGAADRPSIVKLGPEYEPLLIELLRDPIIQASFNRVPTQVAMVELDQMVVYQKHIDVSHARRIEAKLGGIPDRDLLFRTCLPFDHPRPPVQWSRQDSNTFTFVSPSRDMRFLEAMQLGPENLRDYPVSGDMVGIIGLGVGFGSNFLNAIYAEGRLILNNASHRAFALRRMGVTHVPCIVQHVPSRDALSLVACRDVRDEPDRFLQEPRPPMLKDYLNPEITKVFTARRQIRQVTVRFEVTETYLPAL
jgi:hypothetical protein